MNLVDVLRQKHQNGRTFFSVNRPTMTLKLKTIEVDFLVRDDADRLLLTPLQIGKAGAFVGEQVYFKGTEGVVLGFLKADAGQLYGQVDWGIGAVNVQT